MEGFKKKNGRQLQRFNVYTKSTRGRKMDDFMISRLF